MSKGIEVLIKMENLQELINTLEKYSKNDTSKNDRELVVPNDYDFNTGLLDSFEIEYQSEGNDLKIFLENSNIIIFKDMERAIKHLYSFKDDVRYIALNIRISQETLFSNIKYFENMKSILKASTIIDFTDKINKKFYLLSSTYGKIEISYATDSSKLNFYSTTRNLDFKNLEYLLGTENFTDFYKDSIAKLLSESPSKNIYKIINNFDFLIIKSSNALSLYKHNFSFEKFESEFDKSLSSNIKKLQELTSSFQSKIMAIPIQFGVYIYLLSKFNDNHVSILLVVITIITWSIFNYLITSKTYRNVSYLESKIKGEIALIRQRSGIPEDKLSKPQEILSADVYAMKDIIYIYQLFSLAFTVLILIVFALN